MGINNEHIGAAELAKLLEESRHRSEPARNVSDLHPHLAACVSCRQQFEELAMLDIQLKRLRPDELDSRQQDCPSPAVWPEIVAGLTSVEQTLMYTEHASRCDDCGARLRAAVVELADLNRDPTAEERTHIATLESARIEWQQRLAQQISGASQPASDHLSPPLWQRWLAVPRLLIAAASLLVLIAVGSWLVVSRYAQRDEPAAAAQLLARAYTEKRTLELRIAGAEYAPMRVSRGPSSSFTSRPAALLKAEAMIATQLKSHPSDPLWLQASAQADMLEGKYDAAAETLHRALQLEPHSAALLTDLATACFGRARSEDKKDDLGAAYEYLSQALNLRPDDPVALFNRAMVAQHQFLYRQAVDDWEHYLRIDPSSQWAQEARDQVEAVREILREHSSNSALLSLPELVAMTNSVNLAPEVDRRIEEYLQEAVRSWLPQAFPETPGKADPNSSRALFFLADLTSREHGDRWLADLLLGSSASNFPQAVDALSRAVRANGADDSDVSRQQAYLAERLFRASGNFAGVLRAEFEQSFADQVSRRGEVCRLRSIAAEAESKRYSYPWLEIQLGLEESVCSALMDDLGTHERAARRAQERAQQTGYRALYLRALGFVADSKLDTGDRLGVWKLVRTGMECYWSGRFPAMRGYNLYVEEALAADPDQPNLQLAGWREAAAVIDTGENFPLRAEAHVGMANAASAAHHPDMAKRHYEEAARLYALAPQSEATRAKRLVAEITTAQLETSQGAFDAALVRLTRVQDEIRPLSNNFLAEIFYSTLGEVQLGRHHTAEAEQDFRPALRLAELSLSSLTSEKSRMSWSKNAAWNKNAPPVYLGLAEAELVQGRVQESLDVFEWYLSAPQRAGTRTSNTAQWFPNPSRLPAHLPPSTQTVLAFGALPDGLAIWVYDDRGLSATWIPKSSQELQDLAASFSVQCSDPSSQLSVLRRNARTLYDALIAPVEQHLAPGRRLVIETDGWLARVPFEALLDSNDHYLIEHAPIVHSLGQDSQSRLRSDTGISADLPALVIGSTASSPADGLVALPDVAEEADTVAGDFHSAHEFKGGGATLKAVRNELPMAGVFHFAGHSLVTSQGTGLLLEDEVGQGNSSRLLDASAIRRLHSQNLQLAVLSACSTASGSGGASGFDSVTDALLRTGVPHVVASRWAVDSSETRGFVADFYHNALSGLNVSDAIRLTSRKMLANSRTSHPYYWSAFAAYGRP